MAKSPSKAADLAEAVYRRARRSVLRTTGAAVKQLDDLYKADAEEMKRELRKLFASGGLPLVRANRIVDDIMKASRAKRAEVVAGAIRTAAATGKGLDRETFKAIFEGDRDAAVPFGRARSDSPRTRRHSLRLVRASEDASPSTT